MTLKVAFLQLASCWGCHQSLVDMHEKLLDVVPHLEIVHWAAVVDYKYKDLENLPDGSVDIGFVEGCSRTEEDVHLLKVLRKKSKAVVAFGTCSCFGGVYGMANSYSIEACKERKFLTADTVVEGTIPTHDVPDFEPFIVPNDEIVPVDLHIWGCPPETEVILKVVGGVLEHGLDTVVGILQDKGEEYLWSEVLGFPVKTQCDECERTREEKKLTVIKRDFEGIPDPDKCLLEQGYICMGPATRAGCGVRCPNAGVPCTGCWGPAPNVRDQGSKMMSALASICKDIDPEDFRKMVPDTVGTFYKFFLAKALLPRKVKEKSMEV
jgi:F420-non-reducing hydrogenase small subunit